ncbi:MAG: biliverdin-producing heme oxygenase [Gammaproteobacteria bacterium]|nr:MAG: biliverdin-producing heme oxygenase [Gammaproteobacteria bacterium]
MSFADYLREQTAADREFLLAAPIIQDALAARLSRERYVSFLVQAYHHVRHTVPLLMAVGARVGDRRPWLQQQILHYLEEEAGHEQWVLNDIEAAGGDRQAASASLPNVETDAMVAYAWDVVNRRNAVGFFGMVHVLEGTSVALAAQAAQTIRQSLGLPAHAFSYLTSHGELDQQHLQQLRGILDRLSDAEDQAAVLECTRAMYWLYGQMFRGIDRAASDPTRGSTRSAA